MYYRKWTRMHYWDTLKYFKYFKVDNFASAQQRFMYLYNPFPHTNFAPITHEQEDYFFTRKNGRKIARRKQKVI